MEKARIAHEVFNTLCSRTQPHRDTVAAHQIPLVTFFCVSMYGGTARGIGTYLERFWVKIPDYFCLSTYTLSVKTVMVEKGETNQRGHPPRHECRGFHLCRSLAH